MIDVPDAQVLPRYRQLSERITGTKREVLAA